MFTIPTQWIKANSVIELLDTGIEMAREQNGKSPLQYTLDNLPEVPEDKCSMSNVNISEVMEYFINNTYDTFGVPSELLNDKGIKTEIIKEAIKKCNQKYDKAVKNLAEKDCKYCRYCSKSNGNSVYIGRCDLTNLRKREDDYCCRFERRILE